MRKRINNKVIVLHAFSGLSINLSAVYITLAFITPNFIGLQEKDAFIILTFDIFLAIVFLIINIILERMTVK